MRSTFLPGLIISCFLLGAPLPVHPDDQTSDLQPLQPPAGGAAGLAVHGELSTRYTGRAAVASALLAMDHDLLQGLELELSFPGNDRYRAYLSADAREDLDGSQYHTTFYPLKDLNDAWPGPVHANLYEAYIEMQDLLPFLALVRIGRQAGERGEPFFFDGVDAELRLHEKLSLALYGGLAVHFYELDYAWGSDALAGAGLDFRPFASTRLSLDYAFVEDQRVLFLGSNQYNHLLSLKLWQAWAPLLRLTADFRLLNFAPQGLHLRALSSLEAIRLELAAGYFVQFLAQNELSNEFSFYYDVLGRSEPYQNIELKARELLGTHLALDLSFFYRGLFPGEVEGPFNRQYIQASAGIELIDLPISGLSLAVPGEFWWAGSNSYFSTGASIRYQLPAKGRRAGSLEAGSYFSLYKYDYYTLRGEVEQVQTYYLRCRIPLGRYLLLQGGYEYERGLESYHSLTLGVRGEF